MSSEIKPVQNDGTVLAVDQKFGDDAFGEVSTSGKYLPRLQMYGSKSEQVTAGKIPMAHYGLVSGKDNIQDLGGSVNCIPIAWRPKAMDVGGDEIITVFDHLDSEFKRIQADSEVANSGCMFGPEYLVWIPSARKFATLFMSSKTARREAPAIKERLGRPTTLVVELIKTKKFSWHGIVCQPCSTPFDLPDDEIVDEEVEKFNNPPKSEVEKVKPDAAATSARPR